MAIYLVTGGAGFIGSHLAEGLLDRGEQVRIFDNFSTGRRENVEPLLNRWSGSLELIEADLRDYAALESAMEGVEGIFHVAALPSVSRSVEDPFETTEVNVMGTLNCLMAARQAEVRRVVYSSSSSVYGNAERVPTSEEHRCDPRSPYAASKLAGEVYCRVFAELYPLEAVSLRYFNVFGPRQDLHSEYAAVIPKFITRALAGLPLTIHGDGHQTRDFTFVGDVVEANLLAMDIEGVSGQIFNIACGRQISIMELAEVLGELLGAELLTEFARPRSGDIRFSQASIELATGAMGYRPLVPLREGLKETIPHFARKAEGCG